jgi:hypothetical protein
MAVVAMFLPSIPDINVNSASLDGFDWNRFTALEDLDGMDMLLYFYNNQWCVSTLNTVDGRETMEWKDRHGVKSVKEFFWDLWRKLHYKLPSDTTL